MKIGVSLSNIMPVAGLVYWTALVAIRKYCNLLSSLAPLNLCGKFRLKHKRRLILLP
jgi:hypothetical protein